MTGMVQKIAESVEGFAPGLNSDDPVTGRFTWSAEHGHTRHRLMLSLHEVEQISPLDRTKPDYGRDPVATTSALPGRLRGSTVPPQRRSAARCRVDRRASLPRPGQPGGGAR